MQCNFLVKFTGSFSYRRNYIIYIAMFYIFEFPYNYNIKNLFLFNIFSLFIGFLVFFLFTKLILNRNTAISVISSIVLIISNLLIESLIAPINNIVWDLFKVNYINLIFYLFPLLNIFFLIVLLNFILKKYKFADKFYDKPILIMCIPLLFIIFIIRFSSTGVLNLFNSHNLKFEILFTNYQMLFISFFSFASVFIYLSVCHKLIDYFKIKNQNLILEKQILIQKNYARKAKSCYDSTRSFKHDFRNHIIMLNGLIKANEIKKAEQYIQKFERVSENLSLKIHTGNISLDSLLSEKLNIIQIKGIKFTYNIKLPNYINIDDFDLCTIFSNAIDNSIKACDFQDNTNKWIDIKANCINNFLIIDISNYNNTESKLKNRFKLGIGLLNIKKTAEKYNGYIDIKNKNNKFVLTILLNINSK